MWADFMLDDLRMTNSSFIEGYSTNGSLHYVPYDNDARLSYAHGWATSPTSTLSFYAAGLQLTGPTGRTWSVQPRLGSLNDVSSGYETPLGSLHASWTVERNKELTDRFSTPRGTSGTLVLPEGKGRRVQLRRKGRIVASRKGASTYEHLPGGDYTIECARW